MKIKMGNVVDVWRDMPLWVPIYGYMVKGRFFLDFFREFEGIFPPCDAWISLGNVFSQSVEGGFREGDLYGERFAVFLHLSPGVDDSIAEKSHFAKQDALLSQAAVFAEQVVGCGVAKARIEGRIDSSIVVYLLLW